jgi:hypothetical protein
MMTMIIIWKDLCIPLFWLGCLSYSNFWFYVYFQMKCEDGNRVMVCSDTGLFEDIICLEELRKT